MKVVAVDTNLILDFRFKREPGFNRAKDLFQDCSQGNLRIYIPEIVFAEVEWVSRSVYQVPKTTIVEFFEELLVMENVIFKDKKKAIHSVSIFKGVNLKFSDCLILADIAEFEPDEFITADFELQKVYSRLMV